MEARDIYERWSSETLDRPLERRASLGWREMHCADCKGLQLSCRVTAEGVEIMTRIAVNSGLERAIELLTDMSLRKRWDTRVKEAAVLSTTDAVIKRVQMNIDASGQSEMCILELEVQHIAENVVLITFSPSEQSPLQLFSQYTITALAPCEETDEEFIGSAFSDLHSQANSEEMRIKRCQIVNLTRTNSTICKAFAADMIGEAETFTAAWKRFKDLAEGKEAEKEEFASSMSSAVESKSVIGRRKLQSFHDAQNSPREAGSPAAMRMSIRNRSKY